MKTIKIFIIITLTLFSLHVLPQENNDLENTTIQVTFFPPLGTNGIYSANSINKFSWNIIAGYSAGLDGVEFGGIANINRYFMNGVQVAGFGNFTGGDVIGLQSAGFANITTGNVQGLQLAGFTNINTKSFDGIQLSSFSNINIGTTKGLQSAGFFNLTRKESRAVQLSGFGNLAHDLEGVQIAGFSNISTGNFTGVQISGFLNVTRNLNGVQIGVLNIADTVKSGIPIGVLSIVRNGFREFEVGVSEGLNTYASFKIGVTQFYNIFSVGMQNLSDKFRWGFGYGLGTHLANSKNLKVNLELMSYHINEGRNFTKAYNDLQQVKLTFAKPLSENISIFAGPVINLMISDYYGTDKQQTGSGFAPYHLKNHWSGKTNLKYWVGFNAGVRIH